MSSGSRKIRAGQANELWPVFLLLVVVAVPTIGVLWFVGKAMENQHLATQQRLMEAYRRDLEEVQQQIDADWTELLEAGDRLIDEVAIAEGQALVRTLESGMSEAIVVYAESGDVLFPNLTKASGSFDFGPHWSEAFDLELSQPRLAYQSYVLLEQSATSTRERMAALQAQVRCLLNSDDGPAGVELLTRLLDEEVFENLPDADSLSIAANIQLMAIERIDDADVVDRVLDSLLPMVHAYGAVSLASPQRLFLLKQLEELVPDRIQKPVLRGEDMAARFVEMHPSPSHSMAIRESQISGIWQASAPSRRVLLLLTEQSVRDRVARSIASTKLPDDADVEVLRPGQESGSRGLLSLSAGHHLPGWRLSLSLRDSRLVDAAVTERNRLYRWTGFLVVFFTCLLAIVIARAFRRQIHLANLKNDLVGNVSHELKTPLSSMRLLVDTLLEEEKLDESTTREYLELIAKENIRLSRLIENFLTFTRMEEDRHLFDFEALCPRDIVEAAVDAAGERFRAADCDFKVQIEEGVPLVRGDHDSLVTVLLNLLDNAYKYSDAPREVTMMVSHGGSNVCFVVRDNGIGLSRKSMRRIFHRFVQIDQSLARDGGGCGLGLSIVESIVKAHGGTVNVTSSPGRGSTFSVLIPALPEAKQRKGRSI